MGDAARLKIGGVFDATWRCAAVLLYCMTFSEVVELGVADIPRMEG